MADLSKLTGKELADLVRDYLCRAFPIYSSEYDILEEVKRRLEKSDGLPPGIEEALNMGDGTYRP